MFGPRLTTVFASRWKALWLAGVILATAYCSVPAADDSADFSTEASHQAKSPWARNAGEGGPQ